MTAKSGFMSLKRKRLIFYICGVSLPLAQFAIMYVWVNFSSFGLAFMSYSSIDERYSFVGLKNIADAFEFLFTTDYMQVALLRGVLLYFLGILLTPLEYLWSFYVAKKYRFSKFIFTVTYIPGIISGMVMAIIYKNFISDTLVDVIYKLSGTEIEDPLSSGNVTVMFLSIWLTRFIGMGPSIVIVGTMSSSVSPEVVDAAKIDGCTPFKEFLHIYFPLIFPVLQVFIVLGIPGILTSDIGLFLYYGEYADSRLWTLGYYMTLLSVRASKSGT
ncbi:MAG: sugar ABC transporter permease, partial [Clostridia bacterium]|nr:sugar ABC transporter permease [Clostridia bacterium]